MQLLKWLTLVCPRQRNPVAHIQKKGSKRGSKIHAKLTFMPAMTYYETISGYEPFYPIKNNPKEVKRMAIVQYCLIKEAEGAEGTRWRSAWSKDPNSRLSFYVICEELMLLECSLATGMFASHSTR